MRIAAACNGKYTHYKNICKPLNEHRSVSKEIKHLNSIFPQSSESFSTEEKIVFSVVKSRHFLPSCMMHRANFCCLKFYLEMILYMAEQRSSHTEAIIFLFWWLWWTYTSVIQRTWCCVNHRCINQPLFTYFVKARALQWCSKDADEEAAQLITHNCRGADGERRDRDDGSTSNWNAGWQFQQFSSVRQPAEVFLPRPSIIPEPPGVDNQTKPIVRVTIHLAVNYNGCTDASNRRWKSRESGIHHLWMFCQTLVMSA